MKLSSGHDTGWFPRILTLVSFLAWSVQATCCIAHEVLPCSEDDGTQPLDTPASTLGEVHLSCPN